MANTSAATAAKLLNYVPPRPGAYVRTSRPYRRALLAGAAAGVIGAWAMSEYAAISSRWFGEDGRAAWRQGKPLGSAEEMDATTGIAKGVARLAGVSLRRKDEYAAARFVHYAVGAGLGAAYGVLAERAPRATRGLGTVFTTTEWAAGEVLMPRLSVTKPRYSWAVRAHAFTGHLVLGATMELVRRTMLRLWPRAGTRS